MLSEHISTALTHIKRSPYQAFAAISVMSLTFFAAGIFAFLAYSAQATLNYLETRPQIIAFLKDEATPEQISLLENKLNDDPKVAGRVRFVSHSEAFEIFKEIADNPLVTELVPPEALPASLEFSVTNLSFATALIDELRSESIVRQVEFTGSIGGEGAISVAIDNLKRIIQYIRIGGITLLSFLVIMAILILIVIVGMRVASRREEIDTLRLIGATPFFIRAPFLFEAIFYGIFGVIIGSLASLVILIWTLPSLTTYFGEIPVVPRELGTSALLLGILVGSEFLLALIIGILGSTIALARYLRL